MKSVSNCKPKSLEDFTGRVKGDVHNLRFQAITSSRDSQAARQALLAIRKAVNTAISEVRQANA